MIKADRTPVPYVLLSILLAFSANGAAADTQANAGEGYYGSVKLLQTSQSVSNMENTSPRLIRVIDGPDTAHKTSGSLAVGYQFGNGWRTEAEYSLKRNVTFDSYWAPFDLNVNRFQVSSQRLMLNVYRDFALGNGFSAFATLGLGLASVDAQGWQATKGRRFADRAQTNLTYSGGVGISYAVSRRINVDLGYRFVDMGNIESGFNTFANNASARDEQLKANLKSSEVFLGMRMLF